MEVLEYCRGIIANKYATEEKLEQAEYLLLKYLKKNKDAHVYNLLGKLYIKKNESVKAKEFFTKSLQYKELPSNYFGLFKINVLEENFVNAKKFLTKYKQTNTYSANVDSYYLLLQIARDF